MLLSRLSHLAAQLKCHSAVCSAVCRLHQWWGAVQGQRSNDLWFITECLCAETTEIFVTKQVDSMALCVWTHQDVCEDAKAQSCLKQFLSWNIINCSDIVWHSAIVKWKSCVQTSPSRETCAEASQTCGWWHQMGWSLKFLWICFAVRNLCPEQADVTFQKLLFNNSSIPLRAVVFFLPAAERTDTIVLLQRVHSEWCFQPWTPGALWPSLTQC